MPRILRHPSRVFLRQVAAHPECCYFVGLPAGEIDTTKLFVSVHGITRNALEHVLLFRRWIDRLGVVMVAPMFPRTFKGYQVLSAGGTLPAADVAFDWMLADARARFGLPQSRVHAFGFSGGGQFVHRYALKYPGRIARAVIGAAGWYTFPDSNMPYPQGLAAEGAAFADAGAIARFPPTLVIVGSADRVRDPALNKRASIDRQQGRNRHSRGKHWVKEMNAAAAELGLPPPCRFQSLEGATHTFSAAVRGHGLDRAVIDFLFPGHSPTERFIR